MTEFGRSCPPRHRGTESQDWFRQICRPGLFLFLLLGATVFGQTTNPPGGMTAEQIEMQKKLGAATAAAQQDPAVQAAFQKAMKALRESDELMYKKIKQIDPSLTEFVDKMLKAKYPDTSK